MNKITLYIFCILGMFCLPSAYAEETIQQAYTNHAGYAICGVPIALDAHKVTISNDTETVSVPLSIFPEKERRRIASDFGQPIYTVQERRAIAACERDCARQMKRAKLGLCTEEEAREYCKTARAALATFLAAPPSLPENSEKQGDLRNKRGIKTHLTCVAKRLYGIGTGRKCPPQNPHTG